MQGRGQPVDRHALERSGALGDKLLDAVAALAAEHQGSGRALLDALEAGRVRGVGSARIEKLSTWLTEQGYLDPRPVLSAAEREQRLLLSLGASVAPDEIRLVAAGLDAAGTDS
jgi:hypothetical protein